MTSALDLLRARLTACEKPAAAGFTSIGLFDSVAERVSTYQPGGRVKLILGTMPGPPQDVRAYAFDEANGALVGEPEAVQVLFRPTDLVCVLSFPASISTQRLCVVLEGRWKNGRIAGCEMTFDMAT